VNVAVPIPATVTVVVPMEIWKSVPAEVTSSVFPVKVRVISALVYGVWPRVPVAVVCIVYVIGSARAGVTTAKIMATVGRRKKRLIADSSLAKLPGDPANAQQVSNLG
jgi:hypothetical protein